MENENLYITLMQSEIAWEDKSKNLLMWEQKINTAGENTDIIVLPEMFTTGFTMNAAGLAETMDGHTLNWLRRMAQKQKCAITGSIIVSEDGRFLNRLVWVNPDGTFFSYDKRHLFSLAGEEKNFSPGNKKLIVSYKGWEIMPLICYDLRFPVWCRRTLPENYDLLLFVANWPEKRSYAWKQLLIARAIENQSYVGGLNRVGSDGNDIPYSGDSMVIDFSGKIISNIAPESETISTIALNKTAQENFRNQFHFQADADGFEIK